MTHDQALILHFADIRAEDLPRVGGKGANLGELAAAGLPLPTGFFITTRAFWLSMDSGSLAERVYPPLETLDPEDLEGVRGASRKIRRALLRAPIPQPVAEAVLEASRATGREQAYAVRSSATAEELPQASCGSARHLPKCDRRAGDPGFCSPMLGLAFH